MTSGRSPIPRFAPEAPNVYSLPASVLPVPEAIAPGAGAQLHLWPDPAWEHLSQYTSPITQGTPSTMLNCGPASALTAVRLLGLDLPGLHDEHSQAAIASARALTGRGPTETMPTEYLLKIINTANGQGRVTTSLDPALAAVREGYPTIIGGNGRAPGSWTNPTGKDLMSVDHWVCVSGYDPAHRRYIVDDSEWATPVWVTKQQLRAFHGPDDYWGSGIVVSRQDGGGRLTRGTVLQPASDSIESAR